MIGALIGAILREETAPLIGKVALTGAYQTAPGADLLGGPPFGSAPPKSLTSATASPIDLRFEA
jgi:hypothetical protein